jgi:hypothetical protein
MPKMSATKRLLASTLLMLACAWPSLAQSVTAEFDLDGTGSPIPSIGSVTLTLNSDGTFTADVSSTAGIMNFAFNVNGFPAVALATGLPVNYEVQYYPGGSYVYPTFGSFSEFVIATSYPAVTSLHFILSTPLLGGFTSISQLVSAVNSSTPFNFFLSTCPVADSRNEYCVSTPSTEGAVVGTSSPLSIPTKLQASQIGNKGTEIQLTWSYGGALNSIDGFQIDRQTPSQTLSGTWPSPPIVASASSYCALAATGPGVTCIYQDTVPVPYSTYNYRVHAYQGSTVSPNSNEDAAFQVQVTTPLVPFGPSVPLAPSIFVYFSPEPGVSSVSQVAAAFGYDHFNWVSIIEHVPACYSLSPFHEYTGTGSVKNEGNALSIANC